MEKSWTLIRLDAHNAYMNMAIDEALLQFRFKNAIPDTIRFYRWHPSAVSIGYFQSLNDEIDLETCRKLEVDFVRRITGGGAVFHDFEGEITYSFIVKEDNPIIPRDILKSYRVISSGLVEAFSILGLEAEFSGVNDIIVNRKKISGNAQTRKKGIVLQHGTILIDLDVRKMFQVLKVSQEKISDKQIKSVEERVTSIKRELGSMPRFEEVEEALISGFEKNLKTELVSTTIGSDIIDYAKKAKERYMSREWLFMR
jgi:lipoate-protein ligase A